MSKLKKNLSENHASIGTLISIPHISIAEMLSQSGLNWLFIDMEHAPISFSDAQQFIQGMRGNCLSYLRLPYASEVMVKQALDTGCDGIIVPMVNNAELARNIVKWSLYPPEGERSVGYGRSSLFGANLADALQNHNHDFSIFVQIEHRDAVDNLYDIASVSGLDGLFVGPYDLSGSYGKPGQINIPEVQTALKQVVSVCDQNQLIPGIFSADDAQARHDLATGFKFIAISADIVRLSTSCKSTISI